MIKVSGCMFFYMERRSRIRGDVTAGPGWAQTAAIYLFLSHMAGQSRERVRKLEDSVHKLQPLSRLASEEDSLRESAS
jgi:hypothetical protein